MAAETETQRGFGRISRTRGAVFRAVLTVMAFTGVVVLAILLVLTSQDALLPLTAERGWFLVYALAFVAPTLLAFGSLAARRPAAVGFGATSLFAIAAGVMLGGAILVLFVDIVATGVWLAYVLGLAVATALYAAYSRVRSGGGLLERSAVFAVVFGYVLFGIPGSIKSLPDLVLTAPVLPSPWLVLLLTLGIPMAVGAGAVVTWRRDARRPGVVVGGLVFASTLVGGLAAPFVGVDAIAGVVLPLTALAPVAVYAAGVFADPDRRDERPGILLPVVVLGGLVAAELLVGVLGIAGPDAWLDWQFLTSVPSPTPEEAGIYTALVGSVLLMLVVISLSFPIGVGAAIYLEEYAPDDRYTRFIQINISNLAGVPSVVYGLLGLGIFINFGGLNTGSIIVGGMTLALLILPIVIISAQEAIRSVPDSMRQASYGMGATRWQTVRTVVLPRAFPGILTGTILAIGRALGEAAPLIMIAAPTTTFSVPNSLFDAASAMPLVIFEWAFRSQADFRTHVVAAGVITLLVVLLTMNSIAILLRNRYQSEAQS